MQSPREGELSGIILDYTHVKLMEYIDRLNRRRDPPEKKMTEEYHEEDMLRPSKRKNKQSDIPTVSITISNVGDRKEDYMKYIDVHADILFSCVHKSDRPSTVDISVRSDMMKEGGGEKRRTTVDISVVCREKM